MGASEGFLILWDASLVEVWSTESIAHVIMIHDRFVHSNDEFYLGNVYAPCDNGAKQLLWDRLTVILQRLSGKNVCLCSDFNVVRYKEDRRSF